MSDLAEKPAWTQAEAVELCRKVEAVAPAFGCHVALTGGLLYKDGARKDCDLLFYRIRQAPEIDVPGLWEALESEVGIIPRGDGEACFCQKGTYEGKQVDCFFPELCGPYTTADVEEDPFALPSDDCPAAPALGVGY